MNPTRIMLINGILFVVIASLSVLIMTQERELPGEPPVRELREVVAEQLAQESTEAVEEAEVLPNLGSRNLFETLIPLPTPTPQPPKTPVPPPNIQEITENWRLTTAITSFAAFQDTRSREDFTMKIGEEREVQFKGQVYKIVLKSTVKFKSATITVTIDGKTQEHILPMAM